MIAALSQVTMYAGKYLTISMAQLMITVQVRVSHSAYYQDL